MSDARHSQPRRSRAASVARDDTIVAVATPLGRGAVSVVRVSGPETERIGRKVVRPWPTTPRRVTRCTAIDPRTGGVLDHALAVLFPAPASYTGETVLEVHAHGGLVVAPAIEAAFVSSGARPALPGEFTERAYFHGKIDLIGAEAVRELIEARTRAAHRAAINAMSGALTRQYEALRESALALEALLAFDIDFPEEDHGPLARDAVEQAARALEARLRRAADGALAQQRMREGTTVVLAGPPNAGKSSLLNALIGEARAIVSDTPGTTRDAIEVLIDSDPWPLRYVDTAGLRDDPDVVERLGIEVSERYLRGADIVVLCAEHGERASIEDRIREITHAEVVRVRTKSDLALTRERGTEVSSGALDVSSVTGDGIAQLRERIMEAASTQAGGSVHSDAAISARQQAALDLALHEVEDFIAAWRGGDLPTPVVGTHLRAAVNALEELMGSIDADAVLTRVFSTFCVGK